MRLHLVFVLLLVLATPNPSPEKIYSVHLSTWFENAWDRATISPDGHLALYGAPGQIQLIDLRTSSALPTKLRLNLNKVMNAAFLPNGDLARLGVVNGKQGWFVPAGDDLRLSALPSDAIPQWSADGTLAYYLSEKPEAGMYIGTLESQKKYDLTGSVTGFAFSPKGSGVYVLLWQSDGTSSLVRVDRDTGSIHTITGQLDASPFFNSLGVSPDGSRVYIALAGNRPPNNRDRHRPEAKRDLDIYEINMSNGTRRILFPTSADDFAPTGTNGQLYWTRNDFRNAIALVPFAGGKAQEVIKDGEIPRWAPDGKHIAFSYGGQGWPGRLADFALSIDVAMSGNIPDGKDSGTIPFITGTGEDFPPAWSPDGQWIAFHSHRSADPVPSYGSKGQSDDLFIRRASGGKEIRLTDFGWEAGTATWSPDGRHLVFCCWDRANATGYKPWEGGGTPVGFSKPWIVTVDPSSGKALGTERLKLPSSIPGADEAAWSPVNNEIAIEDKIGPDRWAIWVVTPDGTEARKAVEYSSFTYGGLDWSRDGKSIVFAGLSEGKMQLFSVSATGGPPQQLTHDDANLLHPQVSPDGRRIACTRLFETKELWRLRLN